jgi:hypothetical protein
MSDATHHANGEAIGDILLPRRAAGGDDAVIDQRAAATPPAAPQTDGAPATPPRIPNPFTYWTIADLVENPPPPLTPLIGLPNDANGLGIVIAGSMSMIHAAPGSHKSWLALLIARAVASGRPLFGLYPVPAAGRVLYLDFEMGRTLWHERWCALDGADPVDDDTRGRLAVMTQDREPAMALGDTQAAMRMADVVRQIDPDLIVVDTLANAASGDENDARAMTDFMTALRLVSRARPNPDTPAAVVVIHHDNRQGAYRGSVAINASLDDRWQLVPTEDALELRHEKARLRKGLPTIGWRLDELPGGRVEAVPVALVRETTNTDRDDQHVWDILRAMEADGEPTTKRDVALRFRADYLTPGKPLADKHIDATDRVLKRLVDQGRVFMVTPDGPKKRGRVALHYRASTVIPGGR